MQRSWNYRRCVLVLLIARNYANQLWENSWHDQYLFARGKRMIQCNCMSDAAQSPQVLFRLSSFNISFKTHIISTNGSWWEISLDLLELSTNLIQGTVDGWRVILVGELHCIDTSGRRRSNILGAKCNSFFYIKLHASLQSSTAVIVICSACNQQRGCRILQLVCIMGW